MVPAKLVVSVIIPSPFFSIEAEFPQNTTCCEAFNVTLTNSWAALVMSVKLSITSNPLYIEAAEIARNPEPVLADGVGAVG